MLYTEAAANFWIIAIAEAIICVGFVLFGQQIIFLGSCFAFLFGFGIWSRFVVLIPAGDCK